MTNALTVVLIQFHFPDVGIIITYALNLLIVKVEITLGLTSSNYMRHMYSIFPMCLAVAVT